MSQPPNETDQSELVFGQSEVNSKAEDDTKTENKSVAQLISRVQKIADHNIAKSSVKQDEKTNQTKSNQFVLLNDDEIGQGETPQVATPRASLSAIEEVQMSLFDAESNGRFKSFPIVPSTEHPTFLTRIPIFVPARRSNQRDLLDEDNAVPFETSWGRGKKFGPPLTIYDEDTLMAIGRLRTRGLAGRPYNMPLPLTNIGVDKIVDNVNVHIVCCMLSAIQQECGTSQGGKNNKLRLDSVRRLAATTIDLDTKTAEKVIGRGTNIKLIDVSWQEYTDNAILYIQFSPLMARWYEREYTYIDWNVRRQLHDTGKAIHRFLAGQPKRYEIHTKKLLQTIQYLRAYKYFMSELKTAMEKLQENGWITHWEIVGTGRRIPHKLIISRS